MEEGVHRIGRRTCENVPHSFTDEWRENCLSTRLQDGNIHRKESVGGGSQEYVIRQVE